MWSTGKTVHLLKATGVIYDYKPQSQVVQQLWGGHTEETVERNLGWKEKDAVWWDRLDQEDKEIEERATKEGIKEGAKWLTSVCSCAGFLNSQWTCAGGVNCSKKRGRGLLGLSWNTCLHLTLFPLSAWAASFSNRLSSYPPAFSVQSFEHRRRAASLLSSRWL